MSSRKTILGFAEYNNNGSYNHSVGAMMVSIVDNNFCNLSVIFCKIKWYSNSNSIQRDWGGVHFHLMEFLAMSTLAVNNITTQTGTTITVPTGKQLIGTDTGSFICK